MEQNRARDVLSLHGQLEKTSPGQPGSGGEPDRRDHTTQEDLKIQARLDKNTYEAEIKMTDEELASLVIERNSFHGEWNYRINSRGKFGKGSSYFCYRPYWHKNERKCIWSLPSFFSILTGP